MNIAGATLSSWSDNTANTISGPISGTGTVMAATFATGTLNLNAANSFSGTYRAALGTLKINDPNALQNGILDMNAADGGTVDLNNLNANIGALTGSRALALGSGTISIGNHLSTEYSGILSGGGSLLKTGNGTLVLSGANNYAGATSVDGGTLALGAGNVLPGTAVSIGNATLDAATFTNSAGTLNLTGTATLHLGPDAVLAFADSSTVNWNAGTLQITGTLVPGVSLRFGTNSAGLTPAQLALISAPGFTSLSLSPTGYLTATVAGPAYAAWQAANATVGGFAEDHDHDGVSNGVEYFLGGSSNTTGFTALPGVSNSAGVLSVTWTMGENYAGGYGTDFVVETSETLDGNWTPEILGNSVAITGNDVKYTFPAGTGTFVRLKITGP